MSFNANKVTAAFELPPPKPEPIGICLSKNISTPSISYKFEITLYALVTKLWVESISLELVLKLTLVELFFWKDKVS